MFFTNIHLNILKILKTLVPAVKIGVIVKHHVMYIPTVESNVGHKSNTAWWQ